MFIEFDKLGHNYEVKPYDGQFFKTFQYILHCKTCGLNIPVSEEHLKTRCSYYPFYSDFEKKCDEILIDNVI